MSFWNCKNFTWAKTVPVSGIVLLPTVSVFVNLFIIFNRTVGEGELSLLWGWAHLDLLTASGLLLVSDTLKYKFINLNLGNSTGSVGSSGSFMSCHIDNNFPIELSCSCIKDQYAACFYSRYKLYFFILLIQECEHKLLNLEWE